MGKKKKEKKAKASKEVKKLNKALNACEKKYKKLESKYLDLKQAHKDLKQANKKKKQVAKVFALPTKKKSKAPKATKKVKEPKKVKTKGKVAKLTKLNPPKIKLASPVNSPEKKEKVAPRKKSETKKPAGSEKPTETQILARIKKNASQINFTRIGKGSPDKKDNLKRIKGIGPFLERRLNALGIYQFIQISKFTPEDEKAVNEAIEYFQGRIHRDEWVKQAAALASAAK